MVGVFRFNVRRTRRRPRHDHTKHEKSAAEAGGGLAHAHERVRLSRDGVRPDGKSQKQKFKRRIRGMPKPRDRGQDEAWGLHMPRLDRSGCLAFAKMAREIVGSSRKGGGQNEQGRDRLGLVYLSHARPEIRPIRAHAAKWSLSPTDPTFFPHCHRRPWSTGAHCGLLLTMIHLRRTSGVLLLTMALPFRGSPLTQRLPPTTWLLFGSYLLGRPQTHAKALSCFIR